MRCDVAKKYNIELESEEVAYIIEEIENVYQFLLENKRTPEEINTLLCLKDILVTSEVA